MNHDTRKHETIKYVRQSKPNHNHQEQATKTITREIERSPPGPTVVLFKENDTHIMCTKCFIHGLV